MNGVYRGTFSFYRDLPKDQRSRMWRTWVAAFGVFGAVAAAFVGLSYLLL